MNAVKTRTKTIVNFIDLSRESFSGKLDRAGKARGFGHYAYYGGAVNPVSGFP